MDLSVLVARVLALTYISAAIGALSGRVTFSKMVEDFEKSPALTFVAGFFTLVLGVLLVEYHNIWVKDWRVLITLISWMTLLKGIRFLAFPQSISSFKGWYKDTKRWGLIMLAFGLLFGYFGFIK